MQLREGSGEQFPFAQAGAYCITVSSRPSGVVFTWTGEARCDPPTDGPERKSIATQCEVTKGAALTVKNYTRTYLGDPEDANARIVKLPSAP